MLIISIYITLYSHILVTDLVMLKWGPTLGYCTYRQ